MTHTRGQQSDSSDRNKRAKLSNILYKNVDNNEDVSIERQENENTSIPPPVYLKSSRFKSCLVLTFKDGCAIDSLDFVLDSVIIEYKAPLEEIYHHGGKDYVYTYLKDHISIGIPTARYNWILEKASAIDTYRTITDFSTSSTEDYVFLIAEVNTNQVTNCTMYVEETGSIENVGPIYDKMIALKSNLIGVGKFKIEVVANYDDDYDDPQGYVLKFTLNEFQVVDRTDKSGELLSYVKVQPPNALMKTLRSKRQ